METKKLSMVPRSPGIPWADLFRKCPSSTVRIVLGADQ